MSDALNKKFVLKYTIADKEDIYEFKCEASAIDLAVYSLAKSFDKDFNVANISFYQILKDGIDLGEDGILEAEVALQKFYK